MPGITRLKTWVAKEVLLYNDLNAEFDNIINNLKASNVDGYSTSVAQMRETADPGSIGSESLALRMSDELKRIRYAISRIVGKTYWYEAPARSLQATYLDASLYLQGNPYLGTMSATEATSEALLTGYIDGDNFVDNSWIDTTNKKMSDTAFALKNDPAASRYMFIDTAKTSAQSATISLWFRNFAANDTIFYNALSGLRLHLNSSGYIKLYQEVFDSVTNGTKINYSITGSTSLAGSTSFINVIIRWKYGNAITDQVDLLVNGTLIGSISGNILPINVPTAPSNKSVLFANRAPNTVSETLTFPTGGVPGSYGWTKTTTGGTETAASGVLTIASAAAADTLYYTKATAAGALPTNGQYVEMKYKLGVNTGAVTDTAVVGSPFAFYLHNNTSGVGVYCRISHDEISFNKAASGAVDATQGPLLTINHPSSDWTHIFFVMKAAISYVFINGEYKGSFVTGADTTASNELKFGKITASNAAPTIQIEYLYHGPMASTAPDYYLENTTNIQQISDICAIRGFVTDTATITALQSSSPFALFGKSQRSSSFSANRSFWMSSILGTGNSQSIGTLADFYSDGVTPVKIHAMVSFHNSTTPGGTYMTMFHLKLARSYDGNAQHVYPVGFSGTTDSLSTGGLLSGHNRFVLVASQQPQIDIPVITSLVLPAGKWTITGIVNNLLSASSITLDKAKCYVSN